jgi:hypothetical protein
VINPLALLGWWREILIGLLLIALGLQSYRLLGAQGARDLLALEKTERARRDGMRDATNLRNRERTNEEYAAARGRAAAVVVRHDGPGIVAPAIKPAAGADEPTICFERGRLVEALTGWVQRDATRLAELSRGLRERSTDDARAGEEVAAAYRACRGYTLSLE